MQKLNLRTTFLGYALMSALMLVVLLPGRMSAQATPTRTREAGITAFAAYSRIAPDYGPAGNGITVGAAYTYFLKYLSPSLEARYKHGSATAVNESTFGGGLRVEHTISYFHPYADFLISKGSITFANKNYIGSNGTGSNGSIVYSVGGGVDYDFADNWALRVDYQHESWNVNQNPTVELTPHAFSVGVLYRIHLHRPQY